MKNKVETLRAICYTADDMKNYTNLSEDFSDLEIEFMVEFKKIFEMGLEQLYFFMDKLDCQGYELDDYTILYYIEQLLNGPFKHEAFEYADTNKLRYFPKTPDSFGNNGNKTEAPQNCTVLENLTYPLGCVVDVYNKLPKFTQENLKSAIEITESVFRSSLNSSVKHDNTLPIIDKNSQGRYSSEPSGGWVTTSNASYSLKDRYFYLEVERVSEKIFLKVKEYLKDQSHSNDEIKPCIQLPYETWRMFLAKKEYNSFDSVKNESSTENEIYEKDFYDGELKESIKLDILGDELDSVEKRSTVIKVINDSKDKEYTLNTNEGQLGA